MKVNCGYCGARCPGDCLRAKHGATLSYYGTGRAEALRTLRQGPGLSGDVVPRTGSQPTYKKGKVVLIPQPQQPEIIEPLRWLTVGEHAEIKGPKGATDLNRAAGYAARMAYMVTRPLNRRGRRVAFKLETVIVRVTFSDVAFWASWERREGSEVWKRNPSLVCMVQSPIKAWHKTTAVELNRTVKDKVKGN